MDNIDENLNTNEVNETIEPDKMIEDVLNDESLNIDDKSDESVNKDAASKKDEVLSLDNKSDEEVLTEDKESSEESNEELDDTYSYMSSGKKKFLIILLSIFLVLDIAALVIYIIGIDKVLGFIK